MNRNIGLDFLKIIACFAVVVLHVSGMVPVAGSGYGLHDTLYYIASFAVPAFFMVNGYLLLSKEELSYSYIFKKILTILAVVFSWNVIIFLEKLLFERRTTDLLSATYTSLMQGDYFWQFWFFGALILVYLVLPPIHRAFKRTKPAVLMTAALVAACLVIDLTSIVRSAQGLSIVQVHVRQTFRLWTWLAYFLLGGLLGKKQIRDIVLSRLPVAVNWAALVGSVVIISIYQYNMSRIYRDARAEFFYDNIFTFIYVISLFVLFERHNFDRHKNTAIRLVSKNVMGIYIVHVTVITVLTTLLRSYLTYGPVTQMTGIVMILAVFLCSLAVSAVIGRMPLASKLINI